MCGFMKKKEIGNTTDFNKYQESSDNLVSWIAVLDLNKNTITDTFVFKSLY